MSRQYYYLVSGLYDLVPDEEKQSVFIEPFLDFLTEELHPEDLGYLNLFLLANDNRNLMNILEERKGFITPSNYTRDVIEDAVRNPSGLPDYLQTFLEAHKAEEAIVQGMAWEDQLTMLYYAYALGQENRFVTGWMQFERDLRNVLAALNCRRYKLPMQNYLIGNLDEKDFVVEQMMRSTSADFGLSREYPWVEQVVTFFDRNVLIELEKEVDQIRWDMIDDMNTFNYFSTEKVLGYFLKLLITERWFKLIPEEGETMFNTLVGKLKDSFAIDETILS